MQPLKPLLAVVLMLGTLVACTGPDHPSIKASSAPPVTEPPASVQESVAKYQALRVELTAALAQQMPEISWSVDQPATLSRLNDGSCSFSTETMKSSADVVEPSHRFADIFSVGDPVLAKYGFPAFGGTDAAYGGWTVARSMNASGAIVSIESKSPAYLYITAPVDSSTCDPSELPPA